MHKQENGLENETSEANCYFGIQTDHRISVRRPDLVIINKKKELYSPSRPESENKRKRK